MARKTSPNPQLPAAGRRRPGRDLTLYTFVLDEPRPASMRIVLHGLRERMGRPPKGYGWGDLNLRLVDFDAVAEGKLGVRVPERHVQWLVRELRDRSIKYQTDYRHPEERQAAARALAEEPQPPAARTPRPVSPVLRDSLRASVEALVRIDKDGHVWGLDDAGVLAGVCLGYVHQDAADGCWRVNPATHAPRLPAHHARTKWQAARLLVATALYTALGPRANLGLDPVAKYALQLDAIRSETNPQDVTDTEAQ